MWIVHQLKKRAVFFTTVLCSLVTADVLSKAIASATGMAGWMTFLVSFILCALFLFATLYAFEKIFRIEFFGFRRE